MADNRQSSTVLYRGSGWTQSKTGTRPLSGDRSGSTQTAGARRIVPSNPVSSGTGGDPGAAPTRPLRSQSLVTDRGSSQLSWLQNPRLSSAGKRTTINSPKARGTSGRLRNIQARRAGEPPVAPSRAPSGVIGSSDGYRASSELRLSREGTPGVVPPDTFHAFGILGRGVSDSPGSRGRSQTIVSAGGQGKGPSARPSSFSAVTGIDVLQRASSELDPASKALVPGLMPTSVTPEGLIFCEAASHPGEVYVQRTKASRGANPERLNLDRRNLKGCCCLLGEERLRLLNYQHNNISEITHLSGMPNLVFLDLYSNNLTDVSPLSQITSLRVLMLGRNSIKKIQGLASLAKLDVLDLHNNLIESIEGLEGVTGLRILNLAGNHIKSIANLSGLTRLAELNLRRNFISTVRLQGAPLYPGQREKDKAAAAAHLPPQLQRLFLSNNRIASSSELAPLGLMGSLRELAVDNNPITTGPQQRESRYRVLSQCPPDLRLLDLLEVTDDDKLMLMDAQRRREGLAARTSSRGSSQDGWEGREDAEAQAEVQAQEPLRSADSANFGYGISGQPAKLQQPELSKQAAQEPQEQQKSSVAVAWNGSVSGERPQSVIRRPQSAAVRLGAALAKRGAGVAEEKPSSLSTMLQDPRGFSGVPAELVSSHLSEMSQIWTEDLESDSGSDGEKAEGSAAHMASPADLLLARRKQQLHQVRSGPTMPADPNTSGFGAMGVSMSPSRPQSSRAVYTPSGAAAAVSRLYSAQPRGASSSVSSRAVDGQNRAEGYAELVEGGRRLNVFGRATETLKQPSSFEAEEICITYLPCIELSGVIPILGAMGNLRSLVLEENNLCYLHELDLIAPLSQVLRIDVRQGNPVASLGLFRPYLLSRMPGLEAINGQLVKAGERAEAEGLFRVLDRMRESKQECLASYHQLPAPEGSSWSVATEAVDGEGIGGMGGVRSKVFAGRASSAEAMEAAAGSVVHNMLRECITARENLDAFEERWPAILADIVGEAMKAISC